ncbi:MAG: cyclic lactone autoinducer peptide [Bacilli bacterium]
MKKFLSLAIAAVAMLASSAASTGCMFIFLDEPTGVKSFND